MILLKKNISPYICLNFIGFLHFLHFNFKCITSIQTMIYPVVFSSLIALLCPQSAFFPISSAFPQYRGKRIRRHPCATTCGPSRFTIPIACTSQARRFWRSFPLPSCSSDCRCHCFILTYYTIYRPTSQPIS